MVLISNTRLREVSNSFLFLFLKKFTFYDYEMFGVSLLKLLPKMYGQLLRSVENLIQHLDFQLSHLSHITEDDHDAFQIKFTRYLRGTGHPSNLPENLLPLATRQEKADDKLYRARRFLKTLTGLSTLPSDSDWKITVRATCLIL